MRDGVDVRLDAAPTVITFEQVEIDLGGRQIVSPTNLQIQRGEFICIIGPSGCGKTTLLRSVAGFQQPTRGRVTRTEQGREWQVQRPSRDAAFVFQDYGRALLPWRTVRGNVAMSLECASVTKVERAQRVDEVLEAVGLLAHAEKYPGQLSGGMQQRTQIARCLAQSPSVLLMDEPFGALDAMTREGLQDQVARLASEKGLTVLFVTHDLEEAIYLGDRVVAMRANPSVDKPSIAATIDVAIPRPRDQLMTKEHPEFIRLRRELYGFLGHRHE